jgi:hypothetical protein
MRMHGKRLHVVMPAQMLEKHAIGVCRVTIGMNKMKNRLRHVDLTTAAITSMTVRFSAKLNVKQIVI